MPKFNVRCKVSVYYDVEVETKEDWEAEQEGLDLFGQLLDKAEPLPEPLEWEGMEVWEVEKLEEEDA